MIEGSSMAIGERLDQFFDSRSIRKVEGHDKFGWRGQGYDEGWEDATRQEVVDLNALLTQWLTTNSNSRDDDGTCAQCGAYIRLAVYERGEQVWIHHTALLGNQHPAKPA